MPIPVITSMLDRVWSGLCRALLFAENVMGTCQPPTIVEVFLIAADFDARAGSRLCAQLAELSPDTNVVLDFVRAREVSDLALAMLATMLGSPGFPHVIIRGLLRHQERLLLYLGVNPLVLHGV